MKALLSINMVQRNFKYYIFSVHEHVGVQKFRSAVAICTSPHTEGKSRTVRKQKKNLLFKVDVLYM